MSHRLIPAISMAVRSWSTSGQSFAIQRVTVIGAGLMGGGIAQVAAANGLDVTMVDQTKEILDNSKRAIQQSLERIGKKKYANDQKSLQDYVSKSLAKITVETDTIKAVKNADLVIEAIVENLELKQKLFQSLDANAPAHTILASNTSSLPLNEMAANIRRKDKFGGLHFFSPVPMMKLLEVVRIRETSDETFKTLLKFGEKVGKVTVACKDTPDSNSYSMMEALRMVERGDASPEDVDIAMKLGASYPMGPFELADYVGLDVTKFIIDGWSKRFPDNPLFKPSPLLNKLVAEKKLGRKTGEGFYKYQKGKL